MSTPSDSSADESARIEHVYKRRGDSGRNRLYDPERPEVRQATKDLEAALRDVLNEIAPDGLEGLRFLDVGCGAGSHLRRMIEWGALPESVAGTELLADRLDEAKDMTPDVALWHLGSLNELPAQHPFHVVSAFTVFSSILDNDLRNELAGEMWRRTVRGGAVLIYDFRVNNPANRDVRKVTKREAFAMFPDAMRSYRTLTLAPPISRLIAPVSAAATRALAKIPPLRSHFLFVARRTA